MNVLIVYAHPNPGSLSGAVLERLQQGLAEGGHRVSTLDLYEERFDPVLVVDERRRRRDLLNDPYTARYRELIADADLLAFVYPIWWHGPPAILKGFFDRVFVSGFAYSYKGKKKNALLPEGLLAGKKAWFVYTLDAPPLLARLDPGWLVIKYSIFWYCGIRRTTRLMLGGVKRTSAERRERFLERIYRKAAALR